MAYMAKSYLRGDYGVKLQFNYIDKTIHLEANQLNFHCAPEVDSQPLLKQVNIRTHEYIIHFSEMTLWSFYSSLRNFIFLDAFRQEISVFYDASLM